MPTIDVPPNKRHSTSWLSRRFIWQAVRQMAGPQAVGHCFSDGTAVHGRGTSVGTITRSDSSTWVIELPPRSVARLFDVRNRYPYAVDKGLYFASLRLTLGPRR